MTVVEANGPVRAPPEKVFAALTDFAGSKAWLSGVEAASLVTPGPVAVGTKFTQRRVTMGRAANVEGTVLRHEPPRLLVLDVKRDGKPAGVVTWTVTPEAGGAARVGCKVDFQLPGLMKLMTPMIKGTIQKQTAGDIASLAKKVEG